MTGKDTVTLLKERFQEGQDYAHISVVARKRKVEVHHPTEAMMADLIEMGFEEAGYSAIKIWK